MKNLINFFFSFEKLFKEKLIVPFFWLAIIYYGLKYLTQAVDGVHLDPLNFILDPLEWAVKILFTLVSIRIIAELAVAVFRINNNLSPDKGKSETANIDPIEEARKAAEAAAARAKEVTKTASEKASAATKSAVDKTKTAASSAKENAEQAVSSAKTKKAEAAKPAQAEAPKAAAKKSSAAKTTASAKKAPAKTKSKSTAKSTAKAAPKKRGPKPGTKAKRDAQGRLLKKDGTPRAKPGPKKSS